MAYHELRDGGRPVRRAVRAHCPGSCNFDSKGFGGGSPETLGSSSGSATSTGSLGSSGVSVSGGTTIVGTDGTSTTSVDLGSGGAVGSTTTGTTGAGATTGGPPRLADDGLLARYFLADASEGMGPTQVIDAAPNPLALPLTYDAMSWSAIDDHRGLSWSEAGADGRASIDVAGSKLISLSMSTQATIEVVLDVHAVVSQGSRYVHFGAGNAPGDLSLRADDIEHVELYLAGILVEQWPIDYSRGRLALHAVIDLAELSPSHRVRLFVDGVETVPSAESTDLPLRIPDLSVDGFALGNRADGQRSFAGVLYYAALYDAALSPQTIGVDADLLGENDDV